MASRLKRRPKVVWLPLSSENRVGNTGGPAISPLASVIYQSSSSLGFPGLIGKTTIVDPVVLDQGLPVFDANSSLADLESSSYRLRRIVGKLFVLAGQDSDVNQYIGGIVTAGFIVLRVRAGGVPLDAPFDYDVQALGNTMDPWIWRRSWYLSNNANISGAAQPTSIPFGPEINTNYGSVADGPHIDAKTARVVGPEERLFLVITAATVLTGNSQVADILSPCTVFGDFRVLGSMRTNSGNRRNASR